MAIVPYVPRFTLIGTTGAGFHDPEPTPEYHLGDEEIVEERLDLAEQEDEVAPQGSGFVYDPNAVDELIRDK